MPRAPRDAERSRRRPSSGRGIRTRAAKPGGRPDARAAAWETLQDVETRGVGSNTRLAEVDLADDRERHLATTLVYGVLRQRTLLDRLIEKASTRPLDAIDARTLTALRLALFQILFLTRVPRPAVVNEAVRLVRARCGRGAAAFANAVLRSVCRLLDGGLDPLAAPAPHSTGDPVASLCERYSFPPYLVGRFLGRLGRAGCEALLETLNRPAPVVLRVVQTPAADAGEVARRLLDEGVETVPSPHLPDALRILKGTAQRTAVFRDGLVYIQDEAAQIVARLLQPVEPLGGLLDLCAAPGGKLLAAVETLPAGACVVAADLSAARLRLLEENLRRVRIGARVLEVVMDAARPALTRTFGRVLLDAPCSGTGVIRRHPEIRWRRLPESIAACAGQQTRALLAAADLVTPSTGRLVYSVCSLEPEEGRGPIERLLRERPDLRTVDARSILPTSLHRLVDDDGFLATLPHRDDMDGFFAAVLRRI